MSSSLINRSSGYFACVPHVPLTKIQERQDIAANSEFWLAYQKRVDEFREFDPELLVIFGGNHLDGIHLKLMPQFAIAHAAEALADCGGWPGRLDVPMDTAVALTNYLVERDFDIASSYAMEVDHGFSNPLHYFLGDLGATQVLPIHVNTISDPRPTLRRCRQIGEEIGRFARTLNKRVAFLGTGGYLTRPASCFRSTTRLPAKRCRTILCMAGRRGRSAVSNGVRISSRAWTSSAES